MKKQELIKSLEQKGFSEKIINAFKKVKRENFIPENLRSLSYEDTALPIGHEQTISQPYTIAIMLSLLNLKRHQKVLEIGSGCGYVLALINTITKSKTYGIEIVKELAKKSKQNLKKYKEIKVYNEDGSKGLLKEAPFDRILISAACEKIPKELFYQLKESGIIVAPLGGPDNCSLVKIQKKENKFITKRKISGFRFVKLKIK